MFSTNFKHQILAVVGVITAAMGFVSLNGVTALPDSLAADDANHAPALRGEVRHRAVAEIPLPRDRDVFGIGEEVEFWIERLDELNALVSWSSVGGTVYPVVGIATTATVDPSDRDGEFEVTPRRRDSGKPRADDDTANQQLTTKWLREQMAGLPKLALKAVREVPPPQPEFREELLKDIYFELDVLRAGPTAEVRRIDRIGEELLKRYSDLRERGQIYFHLCHVHAQCGLESPERVIELASNALEHPLEDGQIPGLYVYWGDALQLAKQNEPFRERRRAAAVRYLAGLKTVLRYKLPDQAPELPGVDAFDVIGPREAEFQRKHHQQMAARMLAEFLCEMVKHREVLTGQLAALYRREPKDVDELRVLATHVLDNPQAVDRLLAAVQDEKRRKANHE